MTIHKSTVYSFYSYRYKLNWSGSFSSLFSLFVKYCRLKQLLLLTVHLSESFTNTAALYYFSSLRFWETGKFNLVSKWKGNEKAWPEDTHTDGVDVRLVACEGLPAHAVPDVPQFDRGVAGSRHKGAEVGRQGQAHDVAAVAREDRGLLTRLDVPQCTGGRERTELPVSSGKGVFARARQCVETCDSPCGVSWTRDDLIVVNETATWQVTWGNTGNRCLGEFDCMKPAKRRAHWSCREASTGVHWIWDET